MANMETEEFKFPDEVSKESKGKPQDSDIEVVVEGDDEEAVKVEVVDDTPPEDRDVEPFNEEVLQELETADDDAEYSHKIRAKFKKYKKAWHDERRAKEAAFREQQEALSMAQQILDENKRLKSMLHSGEKELIDTYQTSAELELDKAKRSYREAYDSGDTDKLLEAQEEMMRAQLKLDKAKNFKPTVAESSGVDVKTRPVQPQPVAQMDPKVAAWVSQNKWFVDPNKRRMRRYAEGFHEELINLYGDAFVGTDEYFKEIDKEVRQRFPEEFADKAVKNGEEKPRTRLSTVVAPAKRSTSSKRIVLTKTQMALAKKYNLTPEQYAREVMKLEAKNG